MTFMTNGSLKKVESIAECSTWSILQYFWPALSDNWSWIPICDLFEWPFTQVYITQNVQARQNVLLICLGWCFAPQSTFFFSVMSGRFHDFLGWITKQSIHGWKFKISKIPNFRNSIFKTCKMLTIMNIFKFKRLIEFRWSENKSEKLL